MTDGSVRRDDGIGPHVAVLTLNPAPRRALMTHDLVHELRDQLSTVEDDDAVKVVVLRADGPDLCLGLDLDEAEDLYRARQAGGNGKHPSLRARLDAHDELFWGNDGIYTRLSRLKKVCVLAASGRCYGPGLYLALCADLVVAAMDSRFGNPRWRHLGADGDLMMLINAIGLNRARSAVLRGTEWVGQSAREVGLADVVVPSHEITDTAMELAAGVAHVIRDGIAAEKHHVHAALQKAHVGTGFAIGTLAGAMASNIHYRREELNILRERREHGTSAAVRLAAGVEPDGQ